MSEWTVRAHGSDLFADSRAQEMPLSHPQGACEPRVPIRGQREHLLPTASREPHTRVEGPGDRCNYNVCVDAAHRVERAAATNSERGTTFCIKPEREGRNSRCVAVHSVLNPKEERADCALLTASCGDRHQSDAQRSRSLQAAPSESGGEPHHLTRLRA